MSVGVVRAAGARSLWPRETLSAAAYGVRCRERSRRRRAHNRPPRRQCRVELAGTTKEHACCTTTLTSTDSWGAGVGVNVTPMMTHESEGTLMFVGDLRVYRRVTPRVTWATVPTAMGRVGKPPGQATYPGVRQRPSIRSVNRYQNVM
ncbi:Uncharacterised protein [Clostridioides difficile]|nr:Uncharacterised protein [Clostridioides difficile]